jgi:hypothetical protein
MLLAQPEERSSAATNPPLLAASAQPVQAPQLTRRRCQQQARNRFGHHGGQQLRAIETSTPGPRALRTVRAGLPGVTNVASAEPFGAPGECAVRGVRNGDRFSTTAAHAGRTSRVHGAKSPRTVRHPKPPQTELVVSSLQPKSGQGGVHELRVVRSNPAGAVSVASA